MTKMRSGGGGGVHGSRHVKTQAKAKPRRKGGL